MCMIIVEIYKVGIGHSIIVSKILQDKSIKLSGLVCVQWPKLLT